MFSLLSLTRVRSQLLGAGTGVGSCRAFPYRVEEVDWEVCPQETACCNEYGYCRTEVGGWLVVVVIIMSSCSAGGVEQPAVS